ncbi:hypothetical protein ABLO27_16265 [Roseibium sp. SCPC15]|uniref:hypothetical protein n=1 Tax=Roseibium sp. SCP15 TaxID=3141376 RepID=UPI0033375406
MIHPKQEAEDSLALNLAILFFIACAVLISIYFHHDSGFKYILLKNFGETVPGTVTSVKANGQDWTEDHEKIKESPRNTLKNISDWTGGFLVEVKIVPANSSQRTLLFLLPYAPGTSESNDQIPVTYLPLNPNIAYPTDYLPNLSLDGTIMYWTLAIGLVVLLLAARGIRKWASFREKIRRY